MEINFAPKVGTGIKNLIPHAPRGIYQVTVECVDLITKLLMYDPEERISAGDALRCY